MFETEKRQTTVSGFLNELYWCAYFPEAIGSRSKTVEDVLETLKKGTLLWKVRSLAKWYRRKYYLDHKNGTLRYEPSHKAPCYNVNTESEWVSDTESEWVSEWHRVSEWHWEWVSDTESEWVSDTEWVSEWHWEWVTLIVSEWHWEWVSEWVTQSEWVTLRLSDTEWHWERVSDTESEWHRVSDTESEWVSDTESEWHRVSEWGSDTESEWMSEWVTLTEWVTLRVSEWHRVSDTEWVTLRVSEWVTLRVSEWHWEWVSYTESEWHWEWVSDTESEWVSEWHWEWVSDTESEWVTLSEWVSDTDQQLLAHFSFIATSGSTAALNCDVCCVLVLHLVACNTQQLWHILVLKPWIFTTTAATTSYLTFWCFLALPCNLNPFCFSSLSLTPPPPPRPFLQSRLLSPSSCHYLSLCSRMFPILVTV